MKCFGNLLVYLVQEFFVALEFESLGVAQKVKDVPEVRAVTWRGMFHASQLSILEFPSRAKINERKH